LKDLRGVRGERLLLRTRELALSRPVRLLHPRQPIYVVPQGDGRFVVGATVIEREDDGPMTNRGGDEFDRLMTDWLATLASANTKAAYRSDLTTFGRWCTAQGALALQADTATIAAYQAAQQAAGRSAATRRRQWSSLTSFFQFAVDHDAAAADPTQHGERPALSAGALSPTVTLAPSCTRTATTCPRSSGTCTRSFEPSRSARTVIDPSRQITMATAKQT